MNIIRSTVFPALMSRIITIVRGTQAVARFQIVCAPVLTTITRTVADFELHAVQPSS